MNFSVDEYSNHFGKSIKKVVSEPALKLLAFVLAVVLWFLAHGDSNIIAP